MVPFLVTAVVLALLYPWTRVQDAPSGAKLKLVVTAPLVWLLAKGWIEPMALGTTLLFFVFVFVVVLWAPYFAHRYSISFSRFLFSIPVKLGAFRPHYDEARFAASEGRLKEAVELIQDELDKSPTDFEGLMLLASGYQAMEEPEKAIAVARQIQNNPDANPEQQAAAYHVVTECLAQQHDLQLRGRPPKPIPSP
ncbi:MAG: hypothetical protein FJ404_01770 [Verrucomicrobia bacterium]|nr:hypothetical protein [Verrucomicrobiota bacterium]